MHYSTVVEHTTVVVSVVRTPRPLACLRIASQKYLLFFSSPYLLLFSFPLLHLSSLPAAASAHRVQSFFFFFLLLCSSFFEFSFCFLYSILFVCLFCFFTRRILSLLTAPETSAMASDVSYPDPNGNSKVWSESFYKMKSMSFYCGSCIGADSKSSE